MSGTIKHFTFFVPILQMKNRKGRLKNLPKFIRLVSDRAKSSSWAWLWRLRSPHFTLLLAHLSQMRHRAALLPRLSLRHGGRLIPPRRIYWNFTNCDYAFTPVVKTTHISWEYNIMKGHEQMILFWLYATIIEVFKSCVFLYIETWLINEQSITWCLYLLSMIIPLNYKPEKNLVHKSHQCSLSCWRHWLIICYFLIFIICDTHVKPIIQFVIKGIKQNLSPIWSLLLIWIVINVIFQ